MRRARKPQWQVYDLRLSRREMSGLLESATGLVNGSAGLCRAEDPGVGGDAVAYASTTIPRGEVKRAGGVDTVHRNIQISQRCSGLAGLWPTGSLQKINRAESNDGAISGCVDQQRRLFVDGDAARHIRPIIREDAAQESQVAAHAIASDKMRIADQPLNGGDINEVAVQRDVAGEWIGERLAGGDALAGQRAVNELRQHVHPGAGAAHGNTSRNQRVQCAFDGRALPEIDVVGLIAPGNEQRFRVRYRAGHEGIARCRAIRNDQCGDGIFTGTQLLDVRIVRIRTGRPNHQKISAAAALAHPLKSCVDVGAPAHQDRARCS